MWIVGDASPIKQQPYRHPPHRRKVINEEVEYMLQNGVIETADGAWSLPVVATRDGKPDFCVDFRKVNSVTKSHVFLIPKLEDYIDQVD